MPTNPEDCGWSGYPLYADVLPWGHLSTELSIHKSFNNTFELPVHDEVAIKVDEKPLEPIGYLIDNSAGSSVQLVAGSNGQWTANTNQGSAWITMPAITTDGADWKFHIESEVDDEILSDIEEQIDVIDTKLSKLDERLTKMECRLGDGMGRIEQTLDQIVRKVYALH